MKQTGGTTMRSKRILVVDDEKNIRLTLTQALEAEEWETDTAVNGEEALGKLQEGDFGLMLLDLKMPGMDGMEVLRRVAEHRPDVRVLIITAYGTIESAVEAMKLGAVDYLQKPFAPKEIRELVARAFARDKLGAEQASDYDSRLELAKRCINERHFDAAVEHVRAAINIDMRRPEGYNLLGVLLEVRGEKLEAQKQYRIALQVDPTYKPARQNLEQTSTWTARRQAGRASMRETKDQSEGENKPDGGAAADGPRKETR
jgi:DNA-binding response OmpR family regulator